MHSSIKLVYSVNGKVKEKKGRLTQTGKQVHLWLFCHMFQDNAMQPRTPITSRHVSKMAFSLGKSEVWIHARKQNRMETSLFVLQLETSMDKNWKSGGFNSRYSCQDFGIKNISFWNFLEGRLYLER